MKSIVFVVALLQCWVAVFAADETSSTPPVVGGRQRIEVDNSILLSAVEAVQPQILSSINSQYVHRQGKIKEAFSQVVSGIKFYVTLEMGETPCLKATTTNIESCTPSKTKVCQAEIWVQSWLNHNELLKFTCGQ